MKALVLTAPSVFEYQEVPIPSPALEEVLVRIHAAAICGSDVHGMDGSSGRRRAPIIMGHEASGTIEALGDGVQGWSPGERVTFDSTVFCGVCGYCRGGRVNLCDNRRVLGVSCEEYRRDGAFAEFVAVPARTLYRLPGSVSFDQGALAEPLAIALHALRRSPPGLNDRVVVVGAGNIGLLVVQLLRIAGAGRIIAVDPDPSRRSLACRLGADLALEVGPQTVAEIHEACEGQGAHRTFEVVGSAGALKTALEGVRKGGHVVLVGNIQRTVEMALQHTVTRELTLHASCASAGEYVASLDLVSRGAIDLDALISARSPLDAGAEWFRRLGMREPDLLKIVLHPGG